MARHIITIPIETDADPSELLDMAQEWGQQLADELGGVCDVDEVCVSDDGEDTLPKPYVELEDQQIEDLLCTAFEGGVGYWCRIVSYIEPENADMLTYKHSEYPVNGDAVVCQAVVEAEPKDRVLDRAAVERGLRLMAERYPRHWADVIEETTDATTGDIFVQCALLGDVVYG